MSSKSTFRKINKKEDGKRGDVLSGEFNNTANASIAFDWSNALWAKPKPL